MPKNRPKNFIFRREWAMIADTLPNPDRLDFYDALTGFALYGDEYEIPDKVKPLMRVVKYHLEEDFAEYESRCKQNKENARKRWGYQNAEEVENWAENSKKALDADFEQTEKEVFNKAEKSAVLDRAETTAAPTAAPTDLNDAAMEIRLKYGRICASVLSEWGIHLLKNFNVKITAEDWLQIADRYFPVYTEKSVSEAVSVAISENATALAPYFAKYGKKKRKS